MAFQPLLHQKLTSFPRLLLVDARFHYQHLLLIHLLVSILCFIIHYVLPIADANNLFCQCCFRTYPATSTRCVLTYAAPF